MPLLNAAEGPAKAARAAQVASSGENIMRLPEEPGNNASPTCPGNPRTAQRARSPTRGRQHAGTRQATAPEQ